MGWETGRGTSLVEEDIGHGGVTRHRNPVPVTVRVQPGRHGNISSQEENGQE